VLDSLPRKDAVAEMCSGIFNMAYSTYHLTLVDNTSFQNRNTWKAKSPLEECFEKETFTENE
jgi:hypothetical protein